MPEERRYDEREIAAIFEKAAEVQKSARGHPGEGLTLAELQEIGAEAGLLPEFVAHAAALAERSVTAPPPRRYLGLPIGVARTVELPGAFTDADWDRLVADLQDTFHARGRTSRAGGLRSWQNGNLQAVIEPTNNGYRLRLRTLKGDASGSLGLGLAAFVLGLLFLLGSMLGGLDSLGDTGLVMALVGLFVAGSKAVQLPRWAEERARQMDEVAARLAERSILPAGLSAGSPAPSVPSEARLDLDALLDGEADAGRHTPERLRTRG